MSGTYQQGAFEQVWQGGFAARRSARRQGPWSWPVSLAVIASLSLLGWTGAITALLYLLGA